ncbi:MAG: hypothetical protein KKD05_02470 [Candidatus Omnitrophica bacterium]|nr:hypothetical protein [Candidatus Omnitrophota bacterium]
MFLFKKIIAPFLFPLPLTVLSLLAGVLFLWFSKKQKTGKILVTMGLILLFVSSFKFTADAMLRPIEYKFAALSAKAEYEKV